MTVVLRKLTPQEWVQTPKSSDARREQIRRYNKAHPEIVGAYAKRMREVAPAVFHAMRNAQMAVHRAVKRGLLVRPDVCSRCGLPGRRIEAAHHDYSQPLDVTWLCPSCHRFEDRGNAKTKRIA